MERSKENRKNRKRVFTGVALMLGCGVSGFMGARYGVDSIMKKHQFRINLYDSAGDYLGHVK